MKNYFKYALCAIVILLFGCVERHNYNFVVVNKTDKTIGFYAKVVGVVNVDNATIKPNGSFMLSNKVDGNPSYPSFKISNLNDTISLDLSAREFKNLDENKPISKRDSIICKSLSLSGTDIFNWVVTEELFSIMEYDESLLTQFADFYKK